MRTVAHSGWFWTAVWAAMLLAHTAYMGAFADEIDLVDVLLLGGAGIAVCMAALVAMRRGDAEPTVEPARDNSLPTVLAAVGVAALVVGVELGPWLLAMGAGVLVAGLTGLARERREERT